MDDSAIRNYCTWARRELRDEVMRRCVIYDVSEEPQAPAGADAVAGRVLTDVEKRQRRELLEEVRRDGLDRTVERAAYTWFNRIAAIRFMEVNDRLPSRTRLFSANDGSFRPQALQEPLSVDIEGVDRAEVARLVQAGDDEATFRCLLLAQCHELSTCMPDVFERVGAAMELLLPDGLLREGGVVERMVDGIPESDWTEGVEIVGWMYQYYVSEVHEQIYQGFSKGKKANRNSLAAATQLFTPQWIVKYLVDNSLGAAWVKSNASSSISESLEYLIPNESIADATRTTAVENISVIDPACGSGHILAYAFDVLASIYLEQGYSKREIPRQILSQNLTGLEIDGRAASIASFMLSMKACEYDSRFLFRSVAPKIVTLSRIILSDEERKAITGCCPEGVKLFTEHTELIEALSHMDECGSLFVPTATDIELLETVTHSLGKSSDFFSSSAKESLEVALVEVRALAAKYKICIANPPYLGSGNMGSWLKGWITDYYQDSKGDLCTCFLKRAESLTESDWKFAVITSEPWMTKTSFKKFREHLLKTETIESALHLSDSTKHADVFGANIAIACTHAKAERGNKSIFVRLNTLGNESKANTLKSELLKGGNSFFENEQLAFLEMPEYELSYSSADSIKKCFSRFPLLGERNSVKKGITTSDDGRFLRLWFEVSQSRSCLHNGTPEKTHVYKWFPCSKGGAYRKWYGNNWYVVNWENEGYEIRNFTDRKTGKLRSCPRNVEYMFRECISWSDVSSKGMTFRYVPQGHMFNDVGPSVIPERDDVYALAAVLNSATAQQLANAISVSNKYTVGEVARLPVPMDEAENLKECKSLAEECVKLVRRDWDESETSWDFKGSPLLRAEGAIAHPYLSGELIESSVRRYAIGLNDRFRQLSEDEEKLNALVARLYGTEGDVAAEVSSLTVSVRHFNDSDFFGNGAHIQALYSANCSDVVQELISYAVGCMMGRYSLDVDGLVLADQGATLQDYLEKVPNPTFMPDEDGIIPLTDVEYFHDDATGLFVDFLRSAYGEETLEENLAFVAESLGGEGAPREVIRDYFRNRFFADHCKTYSVTGSGKRPIYWLFDSGKKGGFRALFYMHRYTPDLLARLRTDYVHPQQERYRNQIEHIDEVLPTADRREAARLKKERKKLSDQLAETNAYEEKVHHLADQMIQIDLDDGVKHNYALFQDVLAKIK